MVKVRIMNRISLILILQILFHSAWGQSTSLSGKVVDVNNKANLEYSSVALYHQIDSSLVTGAVTDDEGNFELKAKPGQYYLTVQFVGYTRKVVDNIRLGSSKLHLGDIGLRASEKMLQELVVQGQQVTMTHQVDKQIFKAETFQASQGGTATDVLRNMPSLTVNAQGEIAMRGTTGFIVLINGKPVQSDPMLYLNQLPANAIENVEIITTPSAKYDPDGKAGIINITTKKGMDEGLFLQANARVGAPSIEDYNNAEAHQRYGADIGINFRRKKWDISVGANYYRDDIGGQRVGDVNTTINNIFTSFPSRGERSFDRYNFGGRATIGYQIDNKNSLSLGLLAGERTQYRTADILYYDNKKINLNTGEEFGQNTYFNENLRVRRGDFFISSLDYIHTFKNKSSLSASILYEYTMLGGPTDDVQLRYPELQDTLQYTFNDNENPLDGVRFQLDHSTPLAGGKLETGYLYRYLWHEGDFIYQEKILGTNDFVVNPDFSSSIDLERNIHSFYSQFSRKSGKWDYTFGARLEYADRQLTTDTTSAPIRLELFNLFPSANIQYTINDNFALKAAYSRRIERTTSFKMNPFPEREHSETLEQGDANLLPEFIDLAEIGAIWNFDKGTVSATPYYQRIKNVINRVNNVYNDTILNRIYTNAGNAQAFGFELATDLQFNDWWKFYLGGNLYNYSIEGSLFANDVLVNTESFIYSLNLNTTIQISPSFSLQLAYNHLSERITAQGEDSRFYLPSATLRKTFLDGRLAATLQWLNIDMGLLDTNEQRITTYGDNFYTTTNYIYEVDVVMLNLSYQINDLGRKLKFIKSEFGEKEF